MIPTNHDLAVRLSASAAQIRGADDAAAAETIRVYDLLMRRRQHRARTHLSRSSESLIADAARSAVCHFTPANISPEQSAGVFGFDTPEHLKGNGR